MVRLTGPLDVARARGPSPRAIIKPTLDQSGARLAEVGRATEAVLGHVRDQQIENEVSAAEMRTRRALDELRVEIENEPLETTGPDGQPQTYVDRWQERADRIVAENTAALGSPRAQRAWGARMGVALESERSGILQLGQRRSIEQARAGLLTTIATAQNTVIDETATPEARGLALQVIEANINRAVNRRVLPADDGARMIEQARANALEFERTRGMVVREQAEADRIWAESGGNMTLALEMTRDLEGEIEDGVAARLRQRANDTQTAERLTLDSAMGRAYSVIERSGSLDGISIADRQVITRAGQMDTLRTYRDNRNGGGAGGIEAQTRLSAQRRDTMLALAMEDETASAFAGLDLYQPLDAASARVLGLQEGQSVAQQVQPAHLMELRTRQRQMNGEIPVGESQTIAQRAYNMLWSNTTPQAQAMGIGLSAQRDQDRDNVARLRGFLHREAQAFVETNNRLPNQREMQEITALALTNSSNGGGLLGIGSTQRRVFEAREGAQVRVPFSRIPRYQAERLARIAIANGVEIPETEAGQRRLIEEMYQAEISGAEE